jgi:PHD/YefM family antitoxin component YafN of YafNO toxin-antitoxin module
MPKTISKTPADRLAAAKIAEDAAREALTALRERHMAGADPVTAQEFGDAAHALELAEFEREAAEEALTEARRQERLSKLAALRADIENGSAQVNAAEAFTAAVDALAALLALVGPSFGRQVQAWVHQMAQLGVAPLDGREPPSPEDGGLGWRDTITGAKVIYVGDQTMTAYHDHQVLEGVIVAACRKVDGVPARVGGVTLHAPKGLIEDPEKWFGGPRQW